MLFAQQLSLSEKIQIAISLLLKISLIIAILTSILELQWFTIFVSSLALTISVFLPRIISRNYRIILPLEFELIIVAFLYASLFLGEAQEFYAKFWWWDLSLHATSGTALGFTGFLTLFVLYKSKRLDMKPALLAIFSFAFALAFGAIWEIIEFYIDNIFGTNMQKSGLKDTMGDLTADAIGAFFASLIGYIYIKYRKRGLGVLEYLLNEFRIKNPQLFNKK